MYCCGPSLVYTFGSPITLLLVLKYCIIIIKIDMMSVEAMIIAYNWIKLKLKFDILLIYVNSYCLIYRHQ
jgi:hypothetical protein